MRRIVVTGASGFLGGHVLDALAMARPDIQLLALTSSEKAWHSTVAASQHPHVLPIVGRLLDSERWAKQLGHIDGVIHLAALVRHSRWHADEVFRVNVEGTRNMVQLAAQHGARVVFVSTSGTVGCSRNPHDAPNEDAPFCSKVVARWPYYASKIQAEKAARYLASTEGIDVVILRPPAMLGPGDHRLRATGLVQKYLRRALPFMLAGGINTADVRDVAHAVVAALLFSKPKPVYHLPGYAESLASFFTRLERVSGVQAPKMTVPYGVAWAVAQATGHLGMWTRGEILPPKIDPVVIEMGRHYWNLASTCAERDLGYSTRDPAVTLAQTVDWLRGPNADQDRACVSHA